MSGMRVNVNRWLGPDGQAAVHALADAAAAEDGVQPLSEATLLHLRSGEGPWLHFTVGGSAGWAGVAGPPDEAGRPGVPHALGGYAHLELPDGSHPGSAEIVVHPAARRLGAGSALAAAVFEHAPQARIWAHGLIPAAAGFGHHHGFAPVRELWRMSRRLTDGPIHVRIPSGFSVRTFVPGDEQAWLECNAAAFAGHPEQGRMTLADLRARMEEPWFDPLGFFLIEDTSGSQPARLAAFHWTKVTGDEGEVYVVGVHPAYQGRGLGRAATAIGLEHLRRRQLELVTLYVDGDNTAAIRTYQQLGFTRTSLDVQLAVPKP